MRASLLDLLIPAGVLAVVGMMVFPLPPVLLDMLLMCNIAFALLLLISAVFLAEPEKFTTLPTILLLTTLFRLGLNISTTREILGQGTAPEIVRAFGEFVGGGNLVVGVVVFIIITLVQFLVIAKGSERVAEVAARFTLDAMPGKQMAIDADVRAGITSLVEAKERRSALQCEAKLYGALDGAMKFVKGDSIAGLLITLINISAGLLVGMSQLGMSVGEAAERFTIFTIGDGLVSQIPALLVAVGAGIAVTRVSDKSDSFMGREVVAQLTQEPRTLTIAGTALIGLGLVPGLPTMMFVFCGAGMLFFSWSLNKEKAQALRLQADSKFNPAVSSPLLLKLSPKAGLVLHREAILPSLMQQQRIELFNRRGVLVPDIQFEIAHDRVDEAIVQLYLNGTGVADIELNQKAVEAEPATSQGVARKLSGAIERHLSELVSDTETRSLLELHGSAAEDLVNSVIPEMISVTELTTVLRQLVRERVSIKEIPHILQAVAEYYTARKQGSMVVAVGSPEQGGGAELLAAVRVRLGPTICQQFLYEGSALEVYALEAQLEQLISDAAVHAVPLSPALCESLRRQLRQAVDEEPAGASPILLANSASRLVLFELLSPVCPELHILAIEEIGASVRVEIKKVIEIGEEQETPQEDGKADNVVSLARAA